MKKFISLFIVILLILSMAIPVSAENPTEYREKLSTEEMAALFGASKASYSYHVVGDDTVYKGTCTPLIRFFNGSSSNLNNIFVYLPIPDLQGKMIYSFDVIFYLPINIRKCDTILTAVSPSAYCSSQSSNVRYELSPNIEYQLDSTDNKVIYRRSFYGASSNLSTRTYFNQLTNGYYCTSLYTGNTSYYYSATGGTIEKPAMTTSNIAVLGLGQDVGTFGWSWKAGEYTTQSGSDSTTIGLGFIVRNFDITYELNGGYSPTPAEPTDPDPVDPDPVDPDPVDPDPVDPDPTNPDNPTKGEYAEKLDEIYNALVASGQIQIQQNQTIINNQEVIKDKIDGITTPDEQTQQGVDDFATQVDENDKKLDDVAEGMKIDVPDIETELDLSPIDEALTDDNFKSIMTVFTNHSRIISIFIVSFLTSIFGVILRGKKT